MLGSLSHHEILLLAKSCLVDNGRALHRKNSHRNRDLPDATAECFSIPLSRHERILPVLSPQPSMLQSLITEKSLLLPRKH
jgi:hypothetical protein